MKAIGYKRSLSEDAKPLIDVELAKPAPSANDILVKVEAVSVNPVDIKVHAGVTPEVDEVKVLGWDAAGVVEAVGDDVDLIQVGDKVWYAGALDRAGSNAEYQLVDQCIVSKMPESLSFAEAAALPLTTITAWEMLFDRFNFEQTTRGTLLVVGAAGGVGSMMIQLAKQLTDLTVIATASRDETISWVKSLGADHVINHREPLDEALKSIGIDCVDAIAALTNTEQHLPSYATIIAPQGQIALIDDPAAFDIMPFKSKSVSVHWEFMFTRSLFQTEDIIKQHQLLAKTAALVDEGKVKTTLTKQFGQIKADNLIKAHDYIESGKAIGKTVLVGF